MKFDSSNKFNLCFYGQVNSMLLKLSEPSKGASTVITFGGNIYFDGDGTIMRISSDAITNKSQLNNHLNSSPLMY